MIDGIHSMHECIAVLWIGTYETLDWCKWSRGKGQTIKKMCSRSVDSVLSPLVISINVTKKTRNKTRECRRRRTCTITKVVNGFVLFQVKLYKESTGCISRPVLTALSWTCPRKQIDKILAIQSWPSSPLHFS